ncbi:hypothetical protein [Laspinema olomoucense]|uniref:hypothetical protein n=1 Tax=Laspinema olomoucense TaxID=3231600 RepID=UPI0021BB8CCD|nr:hypothetical protein [Laspinema sp. D3a]MCT7989052.1 hypothetical protein [Laspinema sp. D3a]
MEKKERGFRGLPPFHTPQLWVNHILSKQYGIRSAETTTDTGASYALQKKLTFSQPQEILSEYDNFYQTRQWQEMLNNTIKKFLEFENVKGRYLLLVTGATPNADDYPGCFPKSQSLITIVGNVQIQETSVEKLSNWVVTSIMQFDETDNKISTK